MSRPCTANCCSSRPCQRSRPSGPIRYWDFQRMRCCRCPARPTLARPASAAPAGSPTRKTLVRPGLAAAEREIVGIGDLTIGRSVGLDHLVGNALALAIGDRVFLAVEADGELLLHVARRGPAHQRLDRARLLGLVVELPFVRLGPARLHRVFGGLEDACSHGWSGPVRSMGCKRLAEAAGIV